MTRLANRLLFAQALDVATFSAFVALVPWAGFVEANPLVAAAYGAGGLVGVWLMKLGPTLAVAWMARRTAPKPMLIVLLSTATASGMVGTGFNLASLASNLR